MFSLLRPGGVDHAGGFIESDILSHVLLTIPSGIVAFVVFHHDHIFLNRRNQRPKDEDKIPTRRTLVLNRSWPSVTRSTVSAAAVFLGTSPDLVLHQDPKTQQLAVFVSVFPESNSSFKDLDQAVAITAGATSLLFNVYSALSACYGGRCERRKKYSAEHASITRIESRQTVGTGSSAQLQTAIQRPRHTDHDLEDSADSTRAVDESCRSRSGEPEHLNSQGLPQVSVALPAKEEEEEEDVPLSWSLVISSGVDLLHAFARRTKIIR